MKTLIQFSYLLFLFISLGSCSSILKSNNDRLELSVELGTIKGYLIKPEGSGPFPAIVALHGCAGLWRGEGKLNPREKEWANRFVEIGYAVLFPDSFTNRGYPKGNCYENGTANEMHQRERPQDAYIALKWLQKQNYIQAQKIILLGWSNGGSSLLATLDETQNARPKDLKYDFIHGIAFYPGCLQVTKNPIWKNIVPITIFHGENDDWCLASYCQILASQHGLSLYLYADAYHDFDSPNMPLKRIKTGNRSLAKKKESIVGTNEKARKEVFEEVTKLLIKLK